MEFTNKYDDEIMRPAWEWAFETYDQWKHMAEPTFIFCSRYFCELVEWADMVGGEVGQAFLRTVRERGFRAGIHVLFILDHPTKPGEFLLYGMERGDTTPKAQ